MDIGNYIVLYKLFISILCKYDKVDHFDYMHNTYLSII